MILVKCKECGQEMSDTLKRCPHCGHKEKKKIPKKKIIIVLIILVAVIAVGASAGVIIHNNNLKKIKEENEKYNDTLNKTAAEMYLTGIVAEYHCGMIADNWNDCISK